ncbi:MAG: DUF11 domain-containing protein [bacterium]|nr:DUF11 domain-containing protein [bacterium]
MATTISNQANVSFSYSGATEPLTNSSNIVRATVNDEYGISVTLTSSSTSFRPNETITYFVKITNTGSQSLSNIVVNDELSAGNLNYISGTAQMIYNETITPMEATQTSPLEFTLPLTLPAGDSVIVTYNATVDSVFTTRITEIINTVTVTATAGSGTVSDSDSLTLLIEDYADVAIEKTQSSEVLNNNDVLTYTLTLTNSGNLDAQNVVITDQLPAEFIVSSIVSENNGSSHAYLSSEYDISSSNQLTLPNATGTPIVVPAQTQTTSNITTIIITGTINSNV